ncbi:nuclear protein localization protein 4, partial [Tremellales sp. Uapishka_1]
MLLRIRTPAGTVRITVEASTPGADFAQMMLATIPSSEAPDPATLRLSNQPGASGESVPFDALAGRSVGDMGFSHGDLLFVSYKPLSADPTSHPTTQASTSHLQTSQPDPSHPHTHTDPPLPNSIPLVDLSRVQEPEVDQYWSKQNGKIERKRDPTFCKHGEKGMCDYCMPVEPYDSTYQAAQQIKHLSFHAYLRKLRSSQPPSTSSSAAVSLPPLSPLSLSVMTPCPTGSHPPFPAGICSTCQPSALTLSSQSFRMVDHVELASPSLIDNILGAWRRTGTQRIGFLIGRWEKYEIVPMGVKAVVEAIWEPKQQGELDGLTVETPWEDEERVEEIASWCDKGLQVVGMIYTDLTPSPEDLTKVSYKRHAQSFTASSIELLLSAAYQISHPLPTKASPTGHFSSRFVTCCLTGTEEGGIDVIAWQATEQGEAMVKAGIVEASVDPGVVRVRKAGEGEYVPEVFYSQLSEPSTWDDSIKMEVIHWLSDWSLVCFLCMQGVLSVEEQKLLCKVATLHCHPEDTPAVNQLFHSGGWKTLLTIAESSTLAEPAGTASAFGDLDIGSPAGSNGANGGGGEKICPHCTFVNEAGTSDCEICGLPL